MLPDSRQTLYMGINFVVSPAPQIRTQTNLRFQQSLIERGIEFGSVTFQEREITVERKAPTPLIIKVLSTQPPAIGQLVIITPQAMCDVEVFIRECEAAVEAFRATWSRERQVLSGDVTFRDSYEASGQHAFQEIWEDYLGQPGEALSILGWSIQGGGLRFVVPPNPEEQEKVEIELKIESLLRDTKKIWIETQFKWFQPKTLEASMNPRSYLSQIDEYIDNKVVPFIMGRHNE